MLACDDGLNGAVGGVVDRSGHEMGQGVIRRLRHRLVCCGFRRSEIGSWIVAQKTDADEKVHSRQPQQRQNVIRIERQGTLEKAARLH